MVPEIASMALASRPKNGIIARYRQWLPVDDADPVITLGEGNTPLGRRPGPVRAPRL